MGFPFSAVVGHEDLRLALMLTAVDPGIGGVLVRGEKGTAKTTIVRALATLLPPVEVVAGDRFSVDVDAGEQSPDGPFPSDAPRERRDVRLVELPVGASEDRVTGSLDLEEVLAHGADLRAPGPARRRAPRRALRRRGQPAPRPPRRPPARRRRHRARARRARRRLADPPGGVPAGRHHEPGGGRAASAAARPLRAHRAGRRVPGRRASAPRSCAGASPTTPTPTPSPRASPATRTPCAPGSSTARGRLASVALPDAELVRISALCAEVEVDGMRADVVLARTAVAHAAWRGAEAVDAYDVRVAARLALPHRRRRDPFDEPHLGEDELDEAMQKRGRGGGRERAASRGRFLRRTPAPTTAGPDDDGPDDGRSRRRRRRARRRRSRAVAARRRRPGGAPASPAAVDRPRERAPRRLRAPRRDEPRGPAGVPGRRPGVDEAAGAPVRGARHGRGRARATLAGAGQAGSRGARGARRPRRHHAARARHDAGARPGGAPPVSRGPTCATPCARAARATSCSSASTPRDRWRRASG